MNTYMRLILDLVGFVQIADPFGLTLVDLFFEQYGLCCSLRPHFFDLFKKCTGVTPNRVSNAIRMERAITLLTQSSDPMADLAEDLHFATPGNFSRFFKSQIGINPNAFRRTMIADGLHR